MELKDILVMKKKSENKIMLILRELETCGMKIDGVLVGHNFPDGKMVDIERVEIKLAI